MGMRLRFFRICSYTPDYTVQSLYNAMFGSIRITGLFYKQENNHFMVIFYNSFVKLDGKKIWKPYDCVIIIIQSIYNEV